MRVDLSLTSSYSTQVWAKHTFSRIPCSFVWYSSWLWKRIMTILAALMLLIPFSYVPFSYFLQHILKNIYFVEHQSISHAEFTKASCPFFKFCNNWHFLKKWKYTLFVTFQMVNLSYSQSLSCFLFIKAWNCNSKCIYKKSKDFKPCDELKVFVKL